MKTVVASCRHYSDAWHPFIKLFKKFYPKGYAILATDSWSFDEVKQDWDEIISVGEDLGWCKNLISCLSKIEDPYFLFMQEDFFLNEKVDDSFINRCETFMKFDDTINCIRLYPCPGPDARWNDELGIIGSGAPYRVSCQAAIWRKSHLIDILKTVETPWQFEIEGSRSNPSGLYLSVYRDRKPWPVEYYCSAINRGKWNPDALKFCEDNRIYVDKTRREVESK